MTDMTIARELGSVVLGPCPGCNAWQLEYGILTDPWTVEEALWEHARDECPRLLEALQHRPVVGAEWHVEGPFFKDEQSYLSKDGDNPEAAQPGYGWPLGSRCWYFRLEGRGRILHATGLTVESAARRAEALAALP